MQPPLSSAASLTALNTVDRLARAADLWVRHGSTAGHFGSIARNSVSRRELAAGILFGLCDAFGLDEGHLVFTFYVYSLLTNDGEPAMESAQHLLTLSAGSRRSEVFRRGVAEADALMAVLGPVSDQPVAH